MNRSQELSKNTIIILFGRLSTQVINFLLLPLYTALLSTEEYGTADLIITLVQFGIPVISLMIDQGVFRFLLNCIDDKERAKTISSAFFTLAGMSVSFVVIYIICAPFINNDYKIWLLLLLLVTAFSNLFLQVARGLKKTNDYALAGFVCSAATIILNVVFIAFITMGATGMLVATFCGNSICCIFLFVKLRLIKYISISEFDKGIAIEELKYSLPLIPNQLSLWVMNSSARLIILLVLGVSANGILAVSQKFPAIYMTLFSIFLLAWHETGAIHYFDKDRDDFFTDMFKKIISIFSTLCMGIIILLPLVFGWFVNPVYSEAYYNIPIYMVASLFNIVIGLLGVVYVATKKTIEIAKTTILAAIINIIMNLFLINTIGLYAASISTFVGYAVTMVYRIIDTRKYLKIKYDLKQYLFISIALFVCCVIYYINSKLLSLIFIPFFLIAAFFFNRSIIRAGWDLAKSKVKDLCKNGKQQEN